MRVLGTHPFQTGLTLTARERMPRFAGKEQQTSVCRTLPEAWAAGLSPQERLRREVLFRVLLVRQRMAATAYAAVQSRLQRTPSAREVADQMNAQYPNAGEKFTVAGVHGLLSQVRKAFKAEATTRLDFHAADTPWTRDTDATLPASWHAEASILPPTDVDGATQRFRVLPGSYQQIFRLRCQVMGRPDSGGMALGQLAQRIREAAGVDKNTLSDGRVRSVIDTVNAILEPETPLPQPVCQPASWDALGSGIPIPDTWPPALADGPVGACFRTELTGLERLAIASRARLVQPWNDESPTVWAIAEDLTARYPEGPLLTRKDLSRALRSAQDKLNAAHAKPIPKDEGRP